MTDGTHAEAAGAASAGAAPDEATPAEVAQLIVETSALLRGARESRKVLTAWLRGTHRLLGAEAVCVVTRFPGDPAVHVRVSQPREAEWDPRLLGALAGAEDARGARSSRGGPAARSPRRSVTRCSASRPRSRSASRGSIASGSPKCARGSTSRSCAI
jgi:hypothetical protein